MDILTPFRYLYKFVVAKVLWKAPAKLKIIKQRKNQSHELRVDPELQQRRQLYHCGYNFYSKDEIEKYSEVESKQQISTAQDSLFPFSSAINDKISIWRGDMILLEVDAIVNATNERLVCGEGLDAAIHEAAGPELTHFNETFGGCPVGSARLSPGFRLPAKHVISTVPPQKENLLALRSCYEACLDIATMHKEIDTLALCSIASIAKEYPLEKAIRVALDTVRKWLERPYNRKKLGRVIFVVCSDEEEQLYRELMPIYFPKTNSTQP